MVVVIRGDGGDGEIARVQRGCVDFLAVLLETSAAARSDGAGNRGENQLLQHDEDAGAARGLVTEIVENEPSRARDPDVSQAIAEGAAQGDTSGPDCAQGQECGRTDCGCRRSDREGQRNRNGNSRGAFANDVVIRLSDIPLLLSDLAVKGLLLEGWSAHTSPGRGAGGRTVPLQVP